MGSLEISKQCRESLLSMQKSAEVIVAEMRRTESIGISSMTDKGGMADNDRKH